MAPRTKSESGRVTRKDAKSTASKRAPGSGGVGRYTHAEVSGRYTRPIPKNVKRSHRLFGPAILFLMIFGILMILLNYLTVLPGAVSIWYLISGLVIIFVAFLMATRYR
ncbi:MAG: cell division protein CrgA [Acidimicrobiales bacterium]